MRLAQKFARGLAQDGELQGSIALIFQRPVSGPGVRHVQWARGAAGVRHVQGAWHQSHETRASGRARRRAGALVVERGLSHPPGADRDSELDLPLEND